MIGTALLCATFVFTSCDNDDDRYLPESAVLQAFSAKYPNAKRTEWESKYGYKKAEFHIGSQTLYPGAVILEVETEHTGTEVDILHGGIHKEVLLDTANQWILTEWEIRQAQVPEAVMAALRASDYASFRIDDIHVIETPQGLFYEFELERGGQETKVRFTQDGTLVQ